VHDFSDGESPSRRRRGKWRFDDEATFAKRDLHRRSLPPEDAFEGGPPEGDRWSTWDQTEIFISNDLS
jgi:hypothetical protein